MNLATCGGNCPINRDVRFPINLESISCRSAEATQLPARSTTTASQSPSSSLSSGYALPDFTTVTFAHFASTNKGGSNVGGGACGRGNTDTPVVDRLATNNGSARRNSALSWI